MRCRYWSVASAHEGHVWQQRVEGWIHRTLPIPHIDEQERQQSMEVIKVVFQPHIDLMKALSGHGIFAEHDLRLLPPVPSVVSCVLDDLDDEYTTPGSPCDWSGDLSTQCSTMLTRFKCRHTRSNPR
ncbi:hypothetical protein MPH_05275 [Macrophomina phaseolina MS6]|uniref:Uncharacterized protein n=1 Tax=Macrophomina phaseolina (strain MS6) TaxID=1126212 RepID=K2RXS7_MACPH|nr:hypothetical protein MPH_05275 [Macrophomina phaseolina MS6]